MIIARRELIIDHLSPNPVVVPIHIEQPEAVGETRWQCWFEIAWPERLDRRRMTGHDSMAAVVNTLKLIGIEVYASRYHAEGRLYLDDEGGYGFPLPTYLQDSAVGMDKEF